MHILSHKGATTEDNSMAHTVRLRFWAFSKYKLIYLHLFSFACFFFFLKCIFIVTAASVYGFMKLIINRFSFVFSVLLSFLSKKKTGTEEFPKKSVVNRVAMQLQKALCEKGIAFLVNHGISEEKVDFLIYSKTD